jgi:hypothetical protein
VIRLRRLYRAVRLRFASALDSCRRASCVSMRCRNATREGSRYCRQHATRVQALARHRRSLVEPALPLTSLLDPHGTRREAHMRGRSARRRVNVGEVSCESGIVAQGRDSYFREMKCGDGRRGDRLSAGGAVMHAPIGMDGAVAVGQQRSVPESVLVLVRLPHLLVAACDGSGQFGTD